MNDDDRGQDSRIFICHRHADEPIASVLREFVEQWTSGTVQIFQSSHQGAEIGKPLSQQIQTELDRSQMVFLIYTVSDEHSDFAMFEAGFALNRQGDTKIVVFKCGEKAPAPLSDLVFVDVHNEQAVRDFVRQFLTDAGFFPHRADPLTGHSPDSDAVATAADQLVAALNAVPSISPEQYWPTSPYIILEMAFDDVSVVREHFLANRLEEAIAAVRESTVIRNSDAYAKSLFGVMSFAPEADALFTRWESKYADRDPIWIRSLLSQVAAAAADEFPKPELTIFAAESEYWHAPLLIGVYKKPSIQSTHFEVHFPRISKDAIDFEGHTIAAAIA